MKNTDRFIRRRDALSLAAACVAALPTLGCSRSVSVAGDENGDVGGTITTETKNETLKGESMQVHYLEIVTKEVDAACELYSAIHGVTFGEADPSLGGARTAQLAAGGKIGVRAPMHAAEASVTRAYTLVEDIEAAVAAVEKAGVQIAVPPMEIPGHGKCAIYLQDGVEAGLWQL